MILDKHVAGEVLAFVRKSGSSVINCQQEFLAERILDILNNEERKIHGSYPQNERYFFDNINKITITGRLSFNTQIFL